MEIKFYFFKFIYSLFRVKCLMGLRANYACAHCLGIMGPRSYKRKAMDIVHIFLQTHTLKLKHSLLYFERNFCMYSLLHRSKL
ncbi:hypothetical protein JHK85_056967 [Glycine max]|nr:hypothetical protein JHK85_056967 [Glycine max]KAH1035592.1 hypothetical protein GYH30_055530 [Glycine max]